MYVRGTMYLTVQICFRSGVMFELVKFVLYHGIGNVRTNEMGIDLSEFQHVDLNLPAPETVSFSQVKEWFTVNFRLNPQTWTVSVQSVWLNSQSLWVLKPIDRTSKWKQWLEACKRRGRTPMVLVLPVEKEVVSDQGDGG